MFIIIKNIINKNNYFKYIIYFIYIYIYKQSPLFGKEKNSLWMELFFLFFFFQIHLAYGNEVGGNWKTRY